jgi:hypothetical protein
MLPDTAMASPVARLEPLAGAIVVLVGSAILAVAATRGRVPHR